MAMLHIVAIGWLWVVLMMAITEKSVVAGIMTFVFYGLIPCGITLYVLGAPARGLRRQRAGQARNTEETEIEPAPASGGDGAAPK